MAVVVPYDISLLPSSFRVVHPERRVGFVLQVGTSTSDTVSYAIVTYRAPLVPRLFYSSTSIPLPRALGNTVVPSCQALLAQGSATIWVQ